GAWRVVGPRLRRGGGQSALLLVSPLMAGAAGLWAGKSTTARTGGVKLRRLAWALVAGFAILIVANHPGRLVDVVYAKGLPRDPQSTEFAKWNAISRIEVTTENGGRYVVIDADAT